ncbi:MAG: hypothetical protein FWG89_05425 [Treponema sp.]|nr:hypothetical protein [Treponema sp.]
MKKVVMVLFVLAVAMSAYAQVDFGVSGGLMMNFGATLDLEDDDADVAMMFDMLNSGTYIEVSAEIENASAWVNLQSDGGDDFTVLGDATVSLGALDISIGRNWMPWTRWSSIDFWGDNNWGFGASAAKSMYIQASYNFANTVIYAGAAEAGLMNAAPPLGGGFYVGTDYTGEKGFSAGFAFAGVPLGKEADNPEDKFPLMANLYLNFDLNSASIGFNFAFYDTPALAGSLFHIVMNDPLLGDSDNFIRGVVCGPDTPVLEAMFDVGLELDVCDIGFSFGLVANLADVNNGGGANALRLSLCAAFGLGGGFSIIPGFDYINVTSKILNGRRWENEKASFINLGLTFAYSF